jgi:hypothetical protein
VDGIDGILDEIAADPDVPTNEEKEQARDRAKDQFLAVMFLVNSDRAQYGSLVRDIENEYTRGSDTYPTTLSAAYDYLMNYRVDKTSNTHDPDESGLSYYTEDDLGRGQGRGGRGSGRGTGRGRGNHGGRGNETRDGRGRGGEASRLGTQGRVHNQTGDAVGDDDAAYLVDNLDEIDEEYLHAFVGHTTTTGGSLNNTLLLDSCSTDNLITNKTLLHGIHTVLTTMHIQCNAGVTSTNLKGWLGNFPEPVWYNPDGVASIMSLFMVKKHYRVRYDSDKQDALLVTKPNGGTTVFKPTTKGLYALANHLTGWVHVNTVVDQKREYTKHKYRDAVLARKIQNIIMFPGVWAYTKIADSQLIANCPIGQRQNYQAN